MSDAKGGERRTATCTVELTKNGVGLLEVRASAEGSEIRLIVDTGANATVLDRGSAERLGIGGGGDRAEALGCVSESAELTQLGSLRIGDVALAGHPVAVLDLGAVLQRLSGGLGPAPDGILGADILGASRAVIDYGAEQLRLTSASGPAPAQ